jgi:hypothetical protein
MTRFFGGLLLGIGILIMTCSGLCSLVVIVMGFPAAVQEPTVVFIPLIFGGLPFALGFGVFKGGQALLRNATTHDGERSI